MKDISQNQVADRLSQDNPWWDGQDAHPFFAMRARAYLELFLPLVEAENPRRAVVLLGPRRVGKTVMIHQTMKHLMDSGVPPQNICYVSLEVPTYNGLSLEDFLKIASIATSPDVSKRQFVFFDEIQYLKNWEVHLKALVDSKHKMKFVVSGSAAAALRLKSNESGAGRFTEFLLPPVTFYEYLDLQGIDSLVQTDEGECKCDDIETLNTRFVHYLNYGGYPEIIFSPEIQNNPGRFIRNDIIDKVLLRDLPSLYGIQDIQELNSLFTALAYNTANEVSLDELSHKSGVAKNTIKRYLEYLESAFLIKTIHRVDQSCRKFVRKNFFKVYLTNPCMRSALFSPLGDSDEGIGHLVETGIFAQWFHSERSSILHYARWKSEGEVDIVMLHNDLSPLWSIEVKWSDEFPKHPSKLVSLRRFLRLHPKCKASVTTKTIDAEAQLDGHTVSFFPASLYCYRLGRNIIKSRGKLPAQPMFVRQSAKGDDLVGVSEHPVFITTPPPMPEEPK